MDKKEITVTMLNPGPHSKAAQEQFRRDWLKAIDDARYCESLPLPVPSIHVPGDIERWTAQEMRAMYMMGLRAGVTVREQATEQANNLAKYGIGNKLADGSPYPPDDERANGCFSAEVAAQEQRGKYTVSVDFGRALSGEEQERFMDHVMGWRP